MADSNHTMMNKCIHLKGVYHVKELCNLNVEFIHYCSKSDKIARKVSTSDV